MGGYIMSSTINADTTNGVVITSDTSGEIKLQSAGTDTVTVDTSGNVGIGTSSPSRVLHTVTSGDSFIRIQGGVSNAKGIEIHDGTTVHSQIYSVSSDLRFFTNSAEHMRINSSGLVTMPYQPAFMAVGSGGTTTVLASAKVPFNAEFYDNGNNFNTSTYTFTAPVTGTYFFNASMYIQGASSLCFFKNGAQYGYPTPLAIITSTDQFDTQRSISIILYLAANDNVSVNSRGTQSSVLYTPHSSFSGFLIG